MSNQKESNTGNGLTKQQLIERLHEVICELARIYHQLNRLHSEKGGDD